MVNVGSIALKASSLTGRQEQTPYGQWLLESIIWPCVSIGVTKMYVYKALAKEELSQGQHKFSKIQFGCKVYNIQSLLGQMVGPNCLKVIKHRLLLSNYQTLARSRTARPAPRKRLKVAELAPASEL